MPLSTNRVGEASQRKHELKKAAQGGYNLIYFDFVRRSSALGARKLETHSFSEPQFQDIRLFLDISYPRLCQLAYLFKTKQYAVLARLLWEDNKWIHYKRNYFALRRLQSETEKMFSNSTTCSTIWTIRLQGNVGGEYCFWKTRRIYTGCLGQRICHSDCFHRGRSSQWWCGHQC